ncbi:MAG: hypothetical protein HY606_11925 [Planctomycetes bacterium]|nr:hypothetical protein [Planctomycetota bacterium]
MKLAKSQYLFFFASYLVITSVFGLSLFATDRTLPGNPPGNEPSTIPSGPPVPVPDPIPIREWSNPRSEPNLHLNNTFGDGRISNFIYLGNGEVVGGFTGTSGQQRGVFLTKIDMDDSSVLPATGPVRIISSTNTSWTPSNVQLNYDGRYIHCFCRVATASETSIYYNRVDIGLSNRLTQDGSEFVNGNNISEFVLSSITNWSTGDLEIVVGYIDNNEIKAKRLSGGNPVSISNSPESKQRLQAVSKQITLNGVLMEVIVFAWETPSSIYYSVRNSNPNLSSLWTSTEFEVFRGTTGGSEYSMLSVQTSNSILFFYRKFVSGKYRLTRNEAEFQIDRPRFVERDDILLAPYPAILSDISCKVLDGDNSGTRSSILVAFAAGEDVNRTKVIMIKISANVERIQEFLVEVDEADTHRQTAPVMTLINGETQIAVAWNREQSTGADIYFGKFNVDGRKSWPPVALCNVAGNQVKHQLVTGDVTSQGREISNIIVAYEQEGTQTSIFAQQITKESGSLIKPKTPDLSNSVTISRGSSNFNVLATWSPSGIATSHKLHFSLDRNSSVVIQQFNGQASSSSPGFFIPFSYAGRQGYIKVEREAEMNGQRASEYSGWREVSLPTLTPGSAPNPSPSPSPSPSGGQPAPGSGSNSPSPLPNGPVWIPNEPNVPGIPNSNPSDGHKSRAKPACYVATASNNGFINQGVRSMIQIRDYINMNNTLGVISMLSYSKASPSLAARSRALIFDVTSVLLKMHYLLALLAVISVVRYIKR